MTTRRRFFESVAVTVIASVAALTMAPRDAAAFAVIDFGALGQLAVQYTQLRAQLSAMQSQVDALRQAARQLDPRSYQSVQNLLNGNAVNFDALLRDVQSMGYTIDRVNARYHQLFPDERALASKSPAELDSASREMNREMYSAALVAARSQSTLRTIEDNNVEARNILQRSEGNDSRVAQLQSALQMLALIHDNLVGITRLVSASGRVSSNAAAQAVTERRIAREKARRTMRDYVKDEPIPELDSRFLQRGSW